MTYQYLTDAAPEMYPAPDGIAKSVLLNTNKLKFLLIASPTREDLEESIEQYGIKRLEGRWTELLEPPTNGRESYIQALQIKHPKLRTLPSAAIMNLLGESMIAGAIERVQSMSLAEQRDLVQPLKPTSIGEMLALYKDTQIDQTGYRYLRHELGKSASTLDFFGRLTNTLFSGIAESDYTLGTPKPGFHQPRVFEYLGMAAARGWILFPFISGESGTNEMYALMHRSNTKRYLHPMFGPPEVEAIMNATSDLMRSGAAPTASSKYAKFLVVSSTLRSISQSSTALFSRCLELIDNGREDSHRQVGYARRAYNAMLMLHNSQHPDAPRQPPLVRALDEVSLDDFASLNTILEGLPHLTAWGDAMSAFIRSNTNAPASGVVRKTACIEFIQFLAEVERPPQRPEQTLRALINDYTDHSPCYRNNLRRRFDSPDTRNIKLLEMSQFFSFVQDQLRAQHQGHPRDTPWFANPIDIKFDRFAVEYRAGTTRKSIAADTMAEMRQVLVADDYGWAKQWNTDWIFLVNQGTRKLERVWCPSTALCLYTLLSLPLRGLQGRLLDSGEGDAFIYDFDSATMIPNPNQLPINGRLETGRREGFIQVMPSGLTADPELVGMWISVNKTSEDGYAIPWVSDDLLRHLRYQRDWIQRYAPHPNTQTIEDAQGHRNTPTEWIDSQHRFYCLFRDPAVTDRVHDKSLPVSKQKLTRLWGRLSLEVQNRINARSTSEAHRIRLVKPGTENDAYPVAIHDLHTLRVSGITDLLDRGVPLNIVSEYVAGHATYIMTLWYDAPTPGAVRRAMTQAQQRAGDSLGPLPRLLESEIEELKPFLLSNPDFQDSYTGFDALQDNIGLIQVRHSGICPGTRCEEGGLTDKGRIEPVPVGDRGPSCPQCRFWLTGPAFLIGQVIEGNQLIMKIRNKVASLASSREKIMDAEDVGDAGLADLLRGKNDIEERQLNNMLTEWWHRMRFYESSIGKLDAYREARTAKEASKRAESIVLFKQHDKGEANFGYGPATELELKHFLSTCAEILPNFTDEALSAHQDIELAVGKFLAINDERELSSMFFKLDDSQRLAAANLTIELMQRATASPLDATALLEGKTQLQSIPNLQGDLKSLLSGGAVQAMVETKRRLKAK
ncbi:MAG: VPA1269 family protein [Hylemonella sp.]|nr:VPA1269 family protein [Hylemonella sp.]